MPELENTADESNAIDWGPDLPPTTSEKGYGSDWERLRRWCVRRHVGTFGWTCPGYMREAHPARDLQGHHRVPLSERGESIASNVEIWCSACHGRLHAFRQHPLPKRCPAGRVCYRPPSGSPICCGGGS
jgi:hypothetical protein